MRAFLVLSILSTLTSCLAVEISPELRPRILAGEGILEKKVLPPLTSVGAITDIRLGRPRPDASEAMVVAGTQGVVFLEPDTYRVTGGARLNSGEPPFLPHHAVDADGDGTLELFREPGGGSAAALLDAKGGLLWKAKPSGSGFEDAAWGDLEGNGTLCFLLWTFPSDKVSLLGPSGQVLWTQRWERSLHEVQVMDLDRDEKSEIIYLDGEALYVRDRNGTLLRRQSIEKANYVNALHVIRHSDGDRRPGLAVGFNVERPGGEVNQFYRLLELDGKHVKDIEESDLPRYLSGLPAKLVRDEAPYRVRIEEAFQQAFLAGFAATRLDLRIERPDGALLYHEIIMSSQGEHGGGKGAIAVLPTSDGGDRLLVGYGPDLYEYKLPRKR